MADENYDAAADARDGTIELVSAYVSNSNTRITADELQSLIRDTFATLSALSGQQGGQTEAGEPAAERKSKAEIRKSIGSDALISFEDNKPYKSLKRHLTARGMTPAEYRAKWGLPTDYPMVHPAYSARRSDLARSMGLGSKSRAEAPAAGSAKRGRPRKAAAEA